MYDHELLHNQCSGICKISHFVEWVLYNPKDFIKSDHRLNFCYVLQRYIVENPPLDSLVLINHDSDYAKRVMDHQYLLDIDGIRYIVRKVYVIWERESWTFGAIVVGKSTFNNPGGRVFLSK
jgi:hypothetical protein